MKQNRTSRWNAGRTAATAALRYAASLAAWCGWGMMEVKAQDPLWVIGNQQVHFPQEPGTTPGQNLIKTSPLPTSFNPDIPDAFEYQGQVAQRTQNIQYDDEGKVLFFEVDGHIYNFDGLLIGDAASGPGLNDENCQTCLYSGVDMAFVPVPGSCTQFYVISAYQKTVPPPDNTYRENRIRAAILDMSKQSDFAVYENDCGMHVNGRFLAVEEQGLNGAPDLTSFGAIVQGSIEPGLAYCFDTKLSTLQDGTMAFDVIELENQGRHLMVVKAQWRLHMFFIDQAGITIWMPSASLNGYRFLEVSDIFDPNINDFPVIYDVRDGISSATGYRTQLVAHQMGSTLQVAYSSYYRISDDPSTTLDDRHELRVTYWEFGLPAPGAPATISFPMVPGYNPRAYGLDQYLVNGPPDPPADVLGNPIPWPAVGGLHFSPNGHYLFFTKSTHRTAFLYPAMPQSNFGYIDLTVNCGTVPAPCPYFEYMPIAPTAVTRGLADTRLGINKSPDGMGDALYMLLRIPNGDWELAVLYDPDIPVPGNFFANYATFEAIGSRTNTNTIPANTVPYALLAPRVGGSTKFAQMAGEACCEDLTLAKDRSTTITTACDLTWEPGNNAFWNTSEPIHVATELRIEAGAHVVAQNMTFKFGEDAKLTIDPGASFKCTNCLFTNACPEKRWYGIQALTTPGQHQWGSPHPTYQSELDLRASIVEHASIGIRTSGGVINLAAETLLVDDDEDENTPPIEVWTRTIIRNCHRGVMMRSYSNFSPSTGAGMPNRSRFDDVLFSVDPDYMPDYAFTEHVYLWKVSGIPFAACTFENLKADAFFAESSPDPNGPYYGSQFLGHGIRSLDANFRVFGKCGQPWPNGGPPCPENLYTRSIFTGLDHGIHALQGSKLRNFTVDRAQFTDNIAGVYADGVVSYVVKNSDFSIGNRNVELTNPEEFPLWLDHHRGIYSKRCYGFTVDDNTLYKSPGSPNGRKTEGVVIGYSQDHNDYVFRNHGRDLSWGFVGEGNCASTEDSQTAILGLQMICNTNQNNAYNLSSRKAAGDPDGAPSHTIRTQQGDFWRQADNLFDGWPLGNPTKMDFRVTTTFDPISYWHQGSTSPWRPESFDPLLVPAPLLWPPLANNCASKIPSTIPTGPGMVLQDVQDYLEDEKLAYGNVRYLYQQLIDGGSTDEVVDEITAAWPQDAFDLRDYLLSKSPYLSYSVLKELNLQNKLPQAMFAQVCIANPEATKRDGFYNWLENEAPYPLTESLLAAIVASWEERTFRSTLEAQMAGHHAALSQAANVMLEHLTNDEEIYDIPALRGVWQEVRTPEARYAEALSLLDEGDFTNAAATITAIPTEHDLKAPDFIERQRMLDVIAFLATIAGDNRGEDELTGAEQDALEALVDGQQDRPASWAQNILCFHYNRCVAPWTGDAGEPKSLPKPRKESPVITQALSLHPNPTANWAVAKVRLSSEIATATLRVLDVTGKQVATYRLSGKEPQLVLDTRQLGAGAYLVELLNGNVKLASEKLIVQP